MSLRRLRSAAAVGALLAGAVGFWACSSDTAVVSDDTGDDGGNPATGNDGGDATLSGDGNGGDDGSSGDDASPDARHGDGGGKDAAGDANKPETSTDAAVDCGPAPTFAATEAGVVCPFQAGGATSACAIGDHCCVYAKSASVDSTCNASGAPCLAAVDAGGADFACDEPADCNGAGAVCCLTGAVMNDPACYHFGSAVKGTTCRTTACNAGEVTLCAAQSDCPMGTTCTAFSTKTKSLGACL